ncbi:MULTISPECIES: GNAT family N-acetyltransferase [Massilia]|uniref:GNAT family N-acetyltransferase n=1 Tax=Massilia TaxID=149698 RepID=UPI001C6322B6|nr:MULTISPECIES: GNAT family N-acetyltransferase [Massilia]QYG02085.1 GNAT family N-acetyltransferase [Massilia sp. NP310]
MLNLELAHLRLRPALPDDEDFLKTLYASTRDDLRLAAEPPLLDMLLDMQWRAQRAGYRQGFPGADDTIIEAGGAPLGRLLVDRGTRPWRIVDIALLPAARGLGHGAAVLGALQEHAAAEGAALALTVRLDNPGARRLYRACGFVPAESDALSEQMIWPG